MLILTAVMYTFICISAFPAIPRFPVPPALCWGWTCRKTLRPRFTPPTFPASGAAGTSRFLPGCRIISLCRWPGQILAALAACPPSCACSACSLLPASGTAAPRHSSSGVCCRRFTAWAKSCCTAALANPKARHPGPCAVGQASCGVCFVDHQHGVLPRGVRQPFRHGRKPGCWRCFRLPGPLPDEQLVPARFAGELYSTAYTGFTPIPLW